MEEIKLTVQDIKVVTYEGNILKVSKEGGEWLIDSDGLFGILFNGNKHNHVNRIIKMHGSKISYHENGKDYSFFTLGQLETYFLKYKVQQASYRKSLENKDSTYGKYITFVKNGGVNDLYSKICEQLDHEKHDVRYKLPDVKYLILVEEEIRKSKIEELQKKEDVPFLISLLRGSNVFIWSTVLLVIFLTPFTYMALIKYISLSDEGLLKYISIISVAGLSIAFDWSILVFTINGKKILANVGSIFQVIFIAVHFDILADVFTENIQSYVVRIFAVMYAAVLINQFSKLAQEKS